MSTHVPTANPTVRYQIAGGPYGYHVTRCRYDGTRWMLQLAYRVAAPTYEQARGIAARLAATERGANEQGERTAPAPKAADMPQEDRSQPARKANGAKTTKWACEAAKARTGEKHERT